MPGALTPTDPQESHHFNDSFVLTSATLNTSSSALCLFYQALANGAEYASGIRYSLWPKKFSVYTSPNCYQFRCNTRYEWLVRPYSV